jgi:hypothetical protein
MMLLEAGFHLFQKLRFALAADPVGYREFWYPRNAGGFDPKELPAPRTNDFEIHGFTSFLRA